MSTRLIDAVRQSLLNHHIQRTRLLLAVSGGGDSVALLRGICLLASELHLEVQVGHFDHGLRAESAQDANWVRQLCEQLGVICLIKCWNAGGARSHLEERARDARYEFLISTANEIQAPWVLTGHTADDQTETILHHLLRGTGLAGLSGMPQSRVLADGVTLLRPLLGMRRSEIETWLAELNQTWLIDSTNADQSLTRNRLRHNLLPQLRAQFNPQIDEALRRLAQQADEAHFALQWVAQKLAGECVRFEDADWQPTAIIQCAPLQEVPSAVVTTLFVDLWIRLGWPRQKMTFDHWQALAELVHHTGHPTGLSLPGLIQVHWRRGVLSLRRKDSVRPPSAKPQATSNNQNSEIPDSLGDP